LDERRDGSTHRREDWAPRVAQVLERAALRRRRGGVHVQVELSQAGLEQRRVGRAQVLRDAVQQVQRGQLALLRDLRAGGGLSVSQGSNPTEAGARSLFSRSIQPTRSSRATRSGGAGAQQARREAHRADVVLNRRSDAGGGWRPMRLCNLPGDDRQVCDDRLRVEGELLQAVDVLLDGCAGESKRGSHIAAATGNAGTASGACDLGETRSVIQYFISFVLSARRGRSAERGMRTSHTPLPVVSCCNSYIYSSYGSHHRRVEA